MQLHCLKKKKRQDLHCDENQKRRKKCGKQEAGLDGKSTARGTRMSGLSIVADLLEPFRGSFRSGSWGARSRSHKERRINLDVVCVLCDFNLKCNIDKAALQSAISENKSTTLLVLEQLFKRRKKK